MDIQKEVSEIMSVLEIKTGFDQDEPDGGRYFAEAPTLGLKCHSGSEDSASKSLERIIRGKLLNEPGTIEQIRLGNIKLQSEVVSE